MLSTTPLHLLVDRSILEPWRRVLLDGADRVETRGLAKRTICTTSGEVCARGAIMDAQPGAGAAWHEADAEQCRADYELTLWLLAHGAYRHRHVDTVPRWNNAPERTQAEVVSAMRACALEGIVP